MNHDEMKIYTILGHGIAALLMMAYVGGFWVCLAHRKLSLWLVVAAFGFAGLFASAAIGHLASFALRDSHDLGYILYLFGNFTNCVSSLVLVFGLGAALVDLRQKLSRSLDPPYVRR